MKFSELLPNPQVFPTKPRPNDIVLGELSNAYFAAALAALVERPDRVFRLFLTPTVN